MEKQIKSLGKKIVLIFLKYALPHFFYHYLCSLNSALSLSGSYPFFNSA